MVRKATWDPGHWRFRAEEARTIADQMTDEEARTIMRRIANDHDGLAKLAEEQLVAQEAIGRKTWNRLLTLCAYCAIQVLSCQKAWCSRGNGFNEQIFGAKNQVPVGKAIKNSVWTAAAAWRQFVGNS